MPPRAIPPTDDAAGVFLRPGDVRIAFRRVPGRKPGIVFLGGLHSDMTGTKATALEAFAKNRGQAFLRFDYQGHGQSSGLFKDGTIGLWHVDALAVVEAHSDGPQILVGSSMGGWIMLLLARCRPEKVAGLVGIAAAPDFTEDMMWPNFDDEIRRILRRDGVYHAPSNYSDTPYPITYRLIEDARDHLVLRSPLEIGSPVRLLHGMADADVPYMTSIRLAAHIDGNDVQVRLIKDGDHRLSRASDLGILTDTIAALIDVNGAMS